MAERSFAREVEDLRLGAGEEFRGEGILAITKALLQSGVAYVGGYQGAPISHLMDVLADAAGPAGRARRPFRDLGLGGDRRRDAVGLGDVSDPRRGDLEIDRRHQCRLRRAVQSRLRRRHRRRADHHRRGLRRRLLDHAGAQPRLRDEVADLAARSAPQSADRSSRRSRTASNCRRRPTRRSCSRCASAPAMCMAVHRQGQQAPDLHAARGAGKPGARRQPHRAAARLLHAREGEDREALARRGRIHQGAQAQRDVSGRTTARSASSCRAACTTA